MSGITRRSALVIGAAAAAAKFFPAQAAPAEIESHGISAFSDLKYPADFKYFEYVNPDAPKGGLFSFVGTSKQYNQNFFTFNSLNSFVLKGDAALGMELTFASLMTRALDEPDAMYGFAARSVKISGNGTIYRFAMRSEARFHDGTKLTAEDAAFSLNILKEKGHPIIRQLLHDMEKAEAENESTLKVTFSEQHGRETPLFAASLPIFSKTYYGKKNFEDSTLDIPLGSGVYRVGKFEAGRYIEYERVKDWWGAKLPAMRGIYNFDTVRYEFYRDRDIAFEGFTSRNYLFREEFTSRTWATQYNFPAMQDGRVKRRVAINRAPSAVQGWFINTRRTQFKDPHVREAIGLAFDFPWTNKNLMYDSYKRTFSYFQGSDMMAMGMPSPEEIALLSPFRDKLSPDVFGEAFRLPEADGSGQDRTLLRRASALLKEAGYEIKDGKRKNAEGKGIAIEFLGDEPSFERHHAGFIKNLSTLGIEARLRFVDSVQYRARIDDFDFDMAVQNFAFSATPGESLRSYFGSSAAQTKGSQNITGISDPVVDALIEKAIGANDRASLTITCRALDRVLRAGRYWVPHWNKGSYWLAYWDVFGYPAEQPRYARAIPDTWWAKQEKNG
jgi:microcin C transport system substrate-binding protein